MKSTRRRVRRLGPTALLAATSFSPLHGALAAKPPDVDVTADQLQKAEFEGWSGRLDR
jgi:TPP-dependent indolepyruvate ferredoxin oxidoreductase alpha subunit